VRTREKSIHQHAKQVKRSSPTPPIKTTTHLGNSDAQLAIVRNGKPQPNGITMHRNVLALAIISTPALARTGDLSYEAYINSNKRIKCLYGYAAEKTGDHQTAIAIFEDCIARAGSQDRSALERAWPAKLGHHLVSPNLGQGDDTATEGAGRPCASPHLRKPLHPERQEHPHPAAHPGPFQPGHDRALCALGAGSSTGCRQVRAFIDLCAGASVPLIR